MTYEQAELIVRDVAELVIDHEDEYPEGALAALTRAQRALSAVDVEAIREALEGPSNDEEHDALVQIADALRIEWTPYEDKEENQ